MWVGVPAMTPWSVVTGPVTYEVPDLLEAAHDVRQTSIWAFPDMLQAAGEVHDPEVRPDTPPEFTATTAERAERTRPTCRCTSSR